jgi:glycosyltransferase involved in cell wall biosynthesis
VDILLISRCPPFPLYHGDRLIIYHLARQLSARRHLIDLVAYYQHPEDLADIPRYEHLFRSVQLIREPRRSPGSLAGRMVRPAVRYPRRAEESWSPEMWRAIEEQVTTRGCDVVHLFGGIHVYEFRPLVRSLPNVIVPYESYSLWLSREVAEARGPVASLLARLRRRFAQSFERWMFAGFDRVVVLTDRDAAALRALAPQLPLVTIPNGVDLDFYAPTGYEPDEPTLLFIGNYDYRPNLDAALRLARDIFPRVREAVPEARLLLVGGNPSPELQALAGPPIEVTGRVPDLRPYFEQALLFVSPLRLGAGIKNKVLEAMAMDVPVVATPLSCDGIPVVHGEHVWLGETDADLVKGIVHLIGHASLRHALRQGGRALVEQYFTWQRVADQYEALYREIIAERRGHLPVTPR